MIIIGTRDISRIGTHVYLESATVRIIGKRFVPSITEPMISFRGHSRIRGYRKISVPASDFTRDMVTVYSLVTHHRIVTVRRLNMQRKRRMSRNSEEKDGANNPNPMLHRYDSFNHERSSVLSHKQLQHIKYILYSKSE